MLRTLHVLGKLSESSRRFIIGSVEQVVMQPVTWEIWAIMGRTMDAKHANFMWLVGNPFTEKCLGVNILGLLFTS